MTASSEILIPAIDRISSSRIIQLSPPVAVFSSVKPAADQLFGFEKGVYSSLSANELDGTGGAIVDIAAVDCCVMVWRTCRGLRHEWVWTLNASKIHFSPI